jgi:hypothetical protein
MATDVGLNGPDGQRGTLPPEIAYCLEDVEPGMRQRVEARAFSPDLSTPPAQREDKSPVTSRQSGRRRASATPSGPSSERLGSAWEQNQGFRGVSSGLSGCLAVTPKMAPDLP